MQRTVCAKYRNQVVPFVLVLIDVWGSPNNAQDVGCWNQKTRDRSCGNNSQMVNKRCCGVVGCFGGRCAVVNPDRRTFDVTFQIPSRLDLLRLVSNDGDSSTTRAVLFAQKVEMADLTMVCSVCDAHSHNANDRPDISLAVGRAWVQRGMCRLQWIDRIHDERHSVQDDQQTVARCPRLWRLVGPRMST